MAFSWLIVGRWHQLIQDDCDCNLGETREDLGWSLLGAFSAFLFLKKILFIYLFMRDTQREAETQAEGEAGSLWGARCGTQSWYPGITPWAEGRHSTAEPPRRPKVLVPGRFLEPRLEFCQSEKTEMNSPAFHHHFKRILPTLQIRTLRYKETCDLVTRTEPSGLINRSSLSCSDHK